MSAGYAEGPDKWGCIWLLAAAVMRRAVKWFAHNQVICSICFSGPFS